MRILCVQEFRCTCDQGGRSSSSEVLVARTVAPKIRHIELSPSQGPIQIHAWECNFHTNEAASGSSESRERPGLLPFEFVGLGSGLKLAAIHLCFKGLKSAC